MVGPTWRFGFRAAHNLCTALDLPLASDHVKSYDHWACAQTSHALLCGNAMGLSCNTVRFNLYRWTSQHDANVLRKHQGIVNPYTAAVNLQHMWFPTE